ncbi:MAG: branched-chain amino acid ABC transporter permease [Chloroflexota bacterium]|nr:branched-chain amino acid ABC transporter permease [Chloroflexota bacterium]
MTELAQTLLNGLLLGANYALLALSYTLVFGVLRLLTLAHGQIFMAAGLVALVAADRQGLPLIVTGLVAIVVGASLGVATDLFAFRPVGLGRPIAAAVATIGFALVIENTALQLRGSSTAVALREPLPAPDLVLGPFLLSTVQLFILAIAAVVMVATNAFVDRSRWGMAMRALAESPRLLPLLGIPVGRITVLTLAISGALAGLASFLVALRNGSVSPLAGTDIGLVGLAIMTIGGLGSLPGAMVAGIGLGIVEAFASSIGVGTFQSAVPWLLLVLILLVRPHGILGKPE